MLSRVMQLLRGLFPKKQETYHRPDPQTTITQRLEIDLDQRQITVFPQESPRQEITGYTRMSGDSSELLKLATKLKESGRMDDAVACLRKAYEHARREGVDHGIKTYLKLPMYLQKAGRSDEGWSELNKLVTESSIMNQSDIYDKMRLFLQRDNRPAKAVRFGIFSYFTWAIGLHRQRRRSELRGYFGKTSIESVLRPLLKKAKLEDRLSRLTALIEQEAKSIPDIDLAEFGRRIDSIIHSRF